jgi:hypothetical protein
VKKLTVVVILLCPSLLLGQSVDGRLKKAEAKLKESPEDPDAHLEIGVSWILKGDWDKAIPHLAKGSNEFFKTLAAKEASGQEPLAIAESYLTGSTEIESNILTGASATEKVEAKKEAARLKPFFAARAGYWYGRAWGSLEGKSKDHARDCLRKIFQTGPPRMTGSPKDWTVSSDQKLGLTDVASHSGRKSLLMFGGKRGSPLGQTVVLRPNVKYELSGWVLTDGTDSADDELYAPGFSTSGALILHPKMPALPDQPWWKKLSCEFTAPADAGTLQVRFNVVSTKGVIFLDDVSLTADGKEVLKNGGFEQ